MNKSTFYEIKYINALFLKGQVYDCGGLQNTGSHTVPKLPPTHQMKILQMVIPILMQFCIYGSNWSVASHIMPYVIQRNMT